MTARVTRRAFGTAFAAGLLVRPGHARDAGEARHWILPSSTLEVAHPELLERRPINRA